MKTAVNTLSVSLVLTLVFLVVVNAEDKNYFKYKENGQKYFDDCPAGMDKCENTNGFCVKEVGSSETECACRETRAVYKAEYGCVVPCSDDGMEKCESTNGHCVKEKSIDETCSCPEGAVYKEEYGCVVPCSDDGMEKCESTNGLCVKEKGSIKEMCLCPVDAVYKAEYGCVDDFCKIICGNSSTVVCDGDKSVKNKVSCKCKEENKFFDNSSKVCKVDTLDDSKKVEFDASNMMAIIWVLISIIILLILIIGCLICNRCIRNVQINKC